MENLNYLLIGTVVILILSVLLMSVRFRRIRKKLELFRSDIQKTRSEMELIKGRLTQAETIELDLSVLENQIEENSQQLLAHFREKVYEIFSRIKDLEDKMDSSEGGIDDPTERINELETKIEELEEEMDERLTDKAKE